MAPTLFTDDWREFLRLLSRHRVRYLLVGGVAVNLQGHARATQDLDVWLDNQPVNFVRLRKALVEFGFKELGDQIRRIMVSG